MQISSNNASRNSWLSTLSSSSQCDDGEDPLTVDDRLSCEEWRVRVGENSEVTTTGPQRRLGGARSAVGEGMILALRCTGRNAQLLESGDRVCRTLSDLVLRLARFVTREEAAAAASADVRLTRVEVRILVAISDQRIPQRVDATGMSRNTNSNSTDLQADLPASALLLPQ
eukprot:CAMPEP_0114545890 /NCGR_PEP_ID=MMETSP0114-20121206/3649_1 /TAXON_ID=31324 /ORGANISM="Goniomonas sp, Strain m" /LENGTH=170 /DNA_ID=CAMNT_0001730363 /DNA_START=287 /DNA_END=799 /DNA_ORIENTATION=-